MSRAAAALAILGLAACGGGDDDGGAPDDAGVDAIDGPAGDCPAPVDAPAWLDGYLADVVARLAASERATAAQRTAARAYLQGELTGLGLTVSLDDYGNGANVVGELAATEPGATGWIVVGAHFDTVSGSPGANDNATGTATVLATARALAALPCRARGVRFVLFDQEEVGLIGSTTYATRQFQARTPIVAVHTIDQVGWDRDGDRRFEIELPTDALFAAYQASAAAVGAEVVRTTTSGTDHASFRERGFAAAGVTEEYVSGDTTPYYHQPGDTPATVARGYHVVATRLVTHVVARQLGAD